MTPQQAAREILNRRNAAASAVGFAGFVDIPGKPADDEDDDCEVFTPVETGLALHHKMILREVEECFLKDTGRLMIFMPPGSAKSTYGSVASPAYLMGKYPKTRCGLFSYGGTLAKKFGRRTRAVISQPRYGSIMRYKKDPKDERDWPVQLSTGSSAANEFALTNGSEYMATGILGAATGNRFEMLFIDDPIKGREDADSETIREKTWEAYSSDLLTRLVPGGSVCIIQTRWHEDDLAGRILPADWDGESGDILCKDGNVWRVLCIQAECTKADDPLGREPGQMLWTEWFTQKHWDQFRGDARNWGALFQQIPKPADGLMFKPEKINIVEALPAGFIKWVRGWDLAATEGGGKYTVGFRVGVVQATGRILLADMVRGQWGPGNRDTQIANAAIGDGRRVTQDIPDDPGAGGTAQTEYIVKKLRGYPVVWGPESGDKGTRAMPLAAEVNVGNVDMLRADWNKEVKDELRSFPNGTYTDIGDALSRAYARLFPSAGRMSISQELLKRVKR